MAISLMTIITAALMIMITVIIITFILILIFILVCKKTLAWYGSLSLLSSYLISLSYVRIIQITAKDMVQFGTKTTAGIEVDIN